MLNVKEVFLSKFSSVSRYDRDHRLFISVAAKRQNSRLRMYTAVRSAIQR